MRFWIWFVFGVWISAFSNPAQAEYPERLITLIVAVPPGGAGDLVARQFANRLSELLNQNVVIENRGGAAGTIAAALNRKAYTTLEFFSEGSRNEHREIYSHLRTDPE